MSEQKNEMSFLNHLEVLRWTLVRSSMAIFAFGMVAFMMKGFIFNTIILAPKVIVELNKYAKKYMS